MPAIGMFEYRYQFSNRSFSKPRQFRLFESIRHDAINPAAIISSIQVEQLLDRVRQGPWVFDYLPIHIGDVECSVWRVSQLHRAKPQVGRSQEFAFLLVRRTFGEEGHAIAPDFFAVDEIASAVGHEGVSQILLGPSI